MLHLDPRRREPGFALRDTHDELLLIDALAIAVIIVDAAASPCRTNRPADRILAEADGLSLEGSMLSGAKRTATRQLRDTIRAVASGAAKCNMRLSRPSGRAPLLLRALPLDARAARGSVALLVSAPDRPPPLDGAAIAETYRLTPREREIALHLAEGEGLAAIARRLGLSVGTIRDHLKRVFAKTEVRSQVALVALLRGFADPTL